MRQSNYYIPSQANAPYNYELKRSRELNEANKYTEFVNNTKVYYLSEALNYVLTECLKDVGDEANIGREICRTFVREEGYDNLMRKFRTSTCTLALIEECVSNAVSETTSKTDKCDRLTWTINNVEQEKFFDSLKEVPIEKLTKVINNKVCCAAEEFVQRNISAKANIEDAAMKTKERIDKAKAKLDKEKAEQVQKESMINYKRYTSTVMNTQRRNVYEHMMNLASKSIIENDSVRESYLNESGQIDMGKIEDRVKVMYTFLEMVNSLRIKKVDNKYVEECFSSIK